MCQRAQRLEGRCSRPFEKKKKKEFMLKLKKISKIGNKCNSSEIVDILMNHSSTTAHSSFIVHLPAPMSYFATSFCCR